MEQKSYAVVKKDDLENGNVKVEDLVKETIKKETTEPVETKVSKKNKKIEEIEEHIFGTSEKTDTFAEKSATAAANAALKAAINANSEISMREAEKLYFIEKKNNMLRKCREDEVVTRTVSKLLAPFLGKVYTFLYNGIPVTIYCDDKPHEYPKFIAEKIDEKLLAVSESNAYKDVTDDLTDKDTF